MEMWRSGQNHIEKPWLVQPTLWYGHCALGDKIEAGGFKVQLCDGRELVYELADQMSLKTFRRVSPMSMAMGWMKSFLFERPFLKGLRFRFTESVNVGWNTLPFPVRSDWPIGGSIPSESPISMRTAKWTSPWLRCHILVVPW